MERGDLCLVEVMGFDWKPGRACDILGKFGKAEIALSYLIVGNGPHGDKNMSFCLRTDLLASKRHLLEEIKRDFKADKLEVRAPVAILTLYGPHFLEKFNLAHEVFSALCADAIDAHTVSSSVNSISIVVDAIDRDRTVACLRVKFSWPQ